MLRSLVESAITVQTGDEAAVVQTQQYRRLDTSVPRHWRGSRM